MIMRQMIQETIRILVTHVVALTSLGMVQISAVIMSFKPISYKKTLLQILFR